jgi:hypothetical protein
MARDGSFPPPVLPGTVTGEWKPGPALSVVEFAERPVKPAMPKRRPTEQEVNANTIRRITIPNSRVYFLFII